MHVLILNGPNLNLLGTREPQHYGKTSFENYLDKLRQKFPSVEITYQQSNHEGVLIDWLQDAPDYADGVIFNAGAYTHTSIALKDAIQAIATPVIEVHISNILAREGFRQTSYLAPVCNGTVTGFGLVGYELALQSIVHHNFPNE